MAITKTIGQRAGRAMTGRWPANNASAFNMPGADSAVLRIRFFLVGR
jgi:hypothetical protein